MFKRSTANVGEAMPGSTSPEAISNGDKQETGPHHDDTATTTAASPRFKFNKAGGADAAIALFSNTADVQEPVDPAEEKKVVRKIDFMILPVRAQIVLVSRFFYIDKTTLSYAAVFGIEDDLHLVGTQYSWLSSLFYFGFLAWALPTNLLLQRLPVGKYVGFNIFMWGFFLMLQASVNSFAALGALRALAGAAEAVSDPSFMLITSMWYTRRQQPIRMELWYTANGVGIALGGLLGFGIGHIKGALPSWKYEFLVIGALCCIWGIVMFIFLPDSPVTAKGLSTKQKRIAVERLRENQSGVENKQFKWYQVRETFTGIKTYLFFFLGMVCNVPNGGISNFGTLIIQGFGFSTLVTTLMQIPYDAIIATAILTCVFTNDYMARHGRQTRVWFVLLFLSPNIAGAFGLRFLADNNQGGRLTCYYLTGFYNAAFVLILSITIANTAGHTKKVLTNAILFLGYCTGNIVGPFFYVDDQAP